MDGGFGFGPRAMAFWRMGCAALVFGALAFLRHGRGALPRRADVPRLVACSFFGIALNQVLFLEGLARTTVVNAGLLITLIPVFTYGIALALRQELFRAGRAAGILVALAGATILVLARPVAGATPGASSLAGNLLLVLNCLSYALYLVLARPLLARYPSMVVIAWAFLLTFWCWPFVVVGHPLAPDEPSLRALWGLAYVLVFPTVLAYLLNTYALARVSASTTAVFIYLQPLVTGVTGTWLLGERLGIAAWVAALLLFLGIGLVLRRPSARRQRGTRGSIQRFDGRVFQSTRQARCASSSGNASPSARG
jgi:drug/metabolite transporter (DMT)-like permease